MAKRRMYRGQGKKEIVWDPGEANAKQKLFYMSRTTYTAYGGAKGGGPFSFGKSKARMTDQAQNTVTFADVAGCDEAKEEVQELVDFL